MEASIVRSTFEHAESIAANCRQADVDEFAALGTTPYMAMEYGLLNPGIVCTGLADGVPVCMFGVSDASIIGRVGRPWMVGTTELEKHQKAFLRRNKHMVKLWLDLYSVLYNYVDVRNTQAIKWLLWLGFEFGEAEKIGPLNMPFYRFELRAGG
jgi:hypothetical protein